MEERVTDRELLPVTEELQKQSTLSSFFIHDVLSSPRIPLSWIPLSCYAFSSPSL